MFYRLFTLFEDTVHHVDELIAFNKASVTSGVIPGGSEFREYIDKLRERSRLYSEADQYQDEADFYEDLYSWVVLDGEEENGNSIEGLRNLAADALRKADELVRLAHYPAAVSTECNHTESEG